MSALLFEILTEEIPARMQVEAAAVLKGLAETRLHAAGLGFGHLGTGTTPRRLYLHVDGLPARQADTVEERRGPREGAPAAAVEGFLRGAGLYSLDQCTLRDTGKGKFYFAEIAKPGLATAEVLPTLLRGILEAFPWPKSMRFPAASFRWVRPIQSVLCLLDGTPVPLDLDRIPVGAETCGHRFLAPAPFRVEDFAHYRDRLRRAFVILDRDERKDEIVRQIDAAAKALGLAPVPDPGLLDEVTGLVECPVVLAGRIAPKFMALPPEVLTTAMRTHQKYFALRDGAGALAPWFVTIANNRAEDGGARIVRGNERVLEARLSDAQFFWDQDRRWSLGAMVAKLGERVFHAKLGSVLDKVGRIERLARWLVPFIPGAEAVTVARAAQLAKADLSAGLVGEFPELQGVMGRYLALAAGEDSSVAEALGEHYAPVGLSDQVPKTSAGIAVALADKLDTLAGFFAIDERPTGSKDPFALRRAALGVIRIAIEHRLRLGLREALGQALDGLDAPIDRARITLQLMDFFGDRLKTVLRERGVRPDLIAAVFSGGAEDDLVRLLARVDALAAFLASEDGANLLIAYRRASRIVQIESKKDGVDYRMTGTAALAEPAELALRQRLAETTRICADALQAEDFGRAMAAVAALRGPLDDFFERVTVNVEVPELRRARLGLLAGIGAALDGVADFSKIEG